MRSSECGRVLRSLHLSCCVVFACLAVLSLVDSASATNAVVMESRTFIRGTQDVRIRARITNDVPLRLLAVPLEIRTISGGAFIDALRMSYGERLEGPVLNEKVSYDRFAELDSGFSCNDTHPDSGYLSYDTADVRRLVATSPEAVLFLREGAGNPLRPGSDTLGSLVLDFDIDTLTGMFIIDTTCIAPSPGTHLTFWDTGGDFPLVSFTPGYISVADTVPDTIYVDSAFTGPPDGTESAPYPSIQMAIDSLMSLEAVIFVAPGTYFGPVIYPQGVTLRITAQEGPFRTAIVGDSSNSVVVMSTGTISDVQILEGFTIRDNVATAQGAAGGITVLSPTIAYIKSCIVRNNKSQTVAGIDYRGDGGIVANNWIVDNENLASGFGIGGVSISASATVQFIANTVAGNASSALGTAGLHVKADVGESHQYSGSRHPLSASAARPSGIAAAALSHLHNNIIAFNRDGYGIRAEVSGIIDSAFNNLYFGNGDSLPPNVPFDSSTLVLMDPLFADPLLGDYRITCESPARDAGDDTRLPMGILRDIQGQPRLGPGVPILDIGADEFFDEFKIARFETEDTVGCAPHDVQFNNTSIVCIEENWYWNFGDGNISHDRDPAHRYESPGLYSVQLMAFGVADTYSIVREDYIRVLGLPSASFTMWAVTLERDSIAIPCDPDTCGFEYFDNEIYGIVDSVRACDSITVHFEAEGGPDIDEFKWFFGDGDTAIGDTVNHLYTTPGYFTVELHTTNICGTDTLRSDNLVHIAKPFTVDFTAHPEQGCAPLTVQFVATADADVELFEWDFGDPELGTGVTTSADTVWYIYTSPGSYTVRLIASNFCGADTVVKDSLITLGAAPQVFVSTSHNPDSTVCNPYTVEFDYISTQPIIAWEWDFGDDSTSTDSTPTHTYLEGNRTYSIQLIATGECGADTVTLDRFIRVERGPTVEVSAAPLVGCAGSLPVRFEAVADVELDSVRWFFGDDSTALGPNAEHTFATVGIYEPFLRWWHPCGVGDTPLDTFIVVSTVPVALFSVSADSGYEPLEVGFSDASENMPTAWIWSFGDGDSADVQNPLHSYAPGVFTVALEAQNVCGSDTIVKTDLIQVGGFDLTVDSVGTDGDTILYSVEVDSLVLPYDREVVLSARLTTTPPRGNLSFVFASTSGIPPFTDTMRAIPTLDLAKGDYVIEVTAEDVTRIAKSANRSLYYAGRSIIAVDPEPIRMDSTQVFDTTSKLVTVTNTAPVTSDLRLIVQAPSVSGLPFDVLGEGADLAPGQHIKWTVLFAPRSKGEFEESLRVRSNDPVNPDFTVPIFGKGIGNQTPPYVVDIVPDSLTETTIDDSIRITFSKAMIPVAAHTILIVQSTRLDTAVAGQRSWTTNRTLDFKPFKFFPADDTISVLVRADIMDTNGNFLDGNRDGLEQKSPIDDFSFTFWTGPGVYPGDTDADGYVNEADILPLGRFWKLQGPDRTNPQPGFTIQPATAWPDRRATHADANGDGVVDSTDICPIAEFFDREVGVPKATVEAWMAEAQGWPNEVVRSLGAALEACPGDGPGRQVLTRFLQSLQTPAAAPRDYALSQNYPNPFNPTTVIEYTLKEDTEVRLEIFNLQGQRIRVLDAGPRQMGRHLKIWDGRDAQGRAMASGMYFYRLVTPSFKLTRKMVLVR